MRILGLLVILLGITFGGHAMIITLPLEELTAQADLVAVVKVASTATAAQCAPGSKVATTLTIDETLKGEKKGDGSIVIETIAGFEDSPVFDTTRKYLVFLKKTATGQYESVNFVQGVWPVADNGAFEGMGTFTTRDQLLAALAASKDGRAVPPAASSPAPLD